MNAPTIYHLKIDRFRCIKTLSWHPTKGVNVILGGGDVGKTTILDAIGLLLSPTNSTTISDTDYLDRNVGAGFIIEAIVSLPPQSGINQQTKPSWPWDWNGKDALLPTVDGEAVIKGEPVYRIRVRGTEDLELAHEIVQPDGTTDSLSVGVRRSIGLVRLSGDDRNDRDLRLVQGSALDRLLSDKALRSRMAGGFASTEVKAQLLDDKQQALKRVDRVFKERNLPSDLDLAITGSQGLSITALIGLTAKRGEVKLPLASWGAGTRRFAALAIAEQNQGEAPISLVDEIERGLEPYRQRVLMESLLARKAQAFITTHSPSAISAASTASLWYIDHTAKIGQLADDETASQRKNDPETFLARLAVIAEGATEFGFITFLLEKAFGCSLQEQGVHVTDGGGHESALGLLEALAHAGLRFGGFADDEGKHPMRWLKVADKLDKLLLRWASGRTEENVISLLSDDKMEALLTDPQGEKTGWRLRTLADRLGIEEKDFATIKIKAGSNLKTLITSAALGIVPSDRIAERKQYQSHGKTWFKTIEGGRELAEKVFNLGIWPELKPQIMPFCNAARKALNLDEIPDLTT